MSRGRQPSLYLQFLFLVFAGWVNRHQQAVIEYLQAETQSLREQLGNKCLRWTDAQRRRLAEKAKAIGRSAVVVRLPSRSPNLNCFAERWIRSLRQECLSRVILLGEKHLRQTITSCVEHYHMERNHQGLGNRLIEPAVANSNAGEGRIRRRQRLGGLLKYYYRAAA